MTPKTLDHVALWVADRDPIADFCCAHLGMHVDRPDEEKFTLVGSDARRGKLTLFDGRRAARAGALKRVALRVSSLDAALGALDGRVERTRDGEATRHLRGPADRARRGADGGRVRPRPRRALVSHVPRRRPRVRSGSASRLPAGTVGRAARRGRRRVRRIPRRASPGDPERPLLNHLAVLVESAEEHIDEARERGIEIESIVDAANTYAVFVWGPERVRVEYVEHKPTFSLT